MIDIDTRKFIESAKSLSKELDSFKTTLFSDYIEYSQSILDLNNALDYVNTQIDDSNDVQTNQEIVVKFADRYFKGLNRLLTVLRTIHRSNNESLKDDINNQFQDCAINILTLVDDYTELIKSYVSDIKSLLNTTKNKLYQKKDEFISLSLPSTDNNISNSNITEPVISKNNNIPSYFSSTLSNKDRYSLFESYTFSEAGENILMVKETVNQFFITMGQYMNTGISSLGPMFGHLIDIIDKGTTRLEECYKIFMNHKEGQTGLDALFGSDYFWGTVSYAITYGLILIGIIWLVRVILRKVTKFLDWLSGYSKNK